MAVKNTATFGVCTSRAAAEFALQALKAAGYRNADISVLYPQTAGTSTVSSGTWGWLTGIGMLTIPGIGPSLAAGPIVEALTGAGGMVGALIGMGMSEYEASRYEEWVKDGGILLSVHCNNAAWTNGARVILERTGARDVASIGESETERKAS